MQLNPWAVASVLVVGAVTVYLGRRMSRFASTTHDFLVARRTVRSRRNAAAISGEYISAASFLGVAGLVLKDGADALWYPIGFTAGFLALMIFVAAPLRRSGAYTLPDFLEARLGSAALRTVSTWFVVFIGVLYMLPQLQGAGLALTAITPAPAWIGSVGVMVVIALNVVSGGMRAITLVQAFQYWLKLFAIGVPTFLLCLVFLGGAGSGAAGSLGAQTPPEFTEETTVDIQTPVTLRVAETTLVTVVGEQEALWFPGREYPVSSGTELVFPAGVKVPVVSDGALDNASWLRPTETSQDLLWTYSLMLATFLGTMGLPHVLVRFYTNPDGKAARRSTVQVLLLLGLFYLFPILIGALSRLYVPELLVTGRTDAAVLEVPTAMLPGLLGQLVVAVTAAGAFAAFFSTCSGLLVSVAGVIATDLLGGKVRHFRMAAMVVAAVPAGIAVTLPIDDLSLSVGLSFALAASTFCPLLLLGIWWRGLTWVGAMAGMCVGGGLVLVAVGLNMLSRYTGGWAPWFVTQPALFTVTAAFVTTIVVSRGTARRIPDDVNAVMLRLHAPDPLGFMRDRAVARFGSLDDRERGRAKHRR
ncbi:putative symporter [Saccharomonospora marina XMU15]|uniref:Putative symporter n=1 Tax=Saccharomonospora marina XMU15 TaxID=882083 RepID=H5X0D2_9PSEU|nr:cation acetate symporter [Saccharomonospora marina]EHR48592.1 putative symporter [Saccharomonospora marina XMU15]